ncbi:FG-GAP-like repeat-containing protein [Flagellimonas sp.]|uniref:FG-GAP-like repeat-containing protein n=1 Tax=Flagellimonas sp. TaxID=2058762 RepID=UPI003F4A462A
MRADNAKIWVNRICGIICLALLLCSSISYAQTTFTESAAAYNLNIGGGKDGGHAWADYDQDGDYDLVVNTNGAGYLMRNDGGSFTDVTATLAPDFSGGGLERTALFVDFNNDGYPDIFRNDHNDIRIFLQDPATNRFGDGVGGTSPNQRFTSLTDGLNSEGAGALDYDGDGDLDLFIDNHNYGIDILQNDGTGFFTHVTRKADSPNPPYNVADPTTWPLGLVQDATDGDYGSATDFNDDGWVDIVVRKQGQVDLFTNVGGTFQDGVDIDEAANGNKGAVAFGDLDNDGDFDMFWTENGDNQIHRNNGDGTWTAMGAATGIPINFPGQIEGLAFGDVDNDGDLDIFLTGNSTSLLYLNNGGLSFSDSGLSFNTSGEGCTFVDIDNDGDLDLYQNRSGSNSLYINNLGATARANHVYINIKEDRDSFGLTGSEERFGVGATAKILDCDGNVISGTREVNGGFGHGTQESGVIHFGLPGGPSTPIVLEIGYPRTTTGRIIVRSQITPSDFNNGNINLVDLLPDTSNLPPVAQDDNIQTNLGTDVVIDALIDNGNGVDSDPEGSPIEVISITQPSDGTATLNPDGTITYSPGTFVGSTSFTYILGDNTFCSFASAQDTATIFITVLPDNDLDGIVDSVDLDDDNDGILDSVECPNALTVLWVTGGTAGTEEQNTIDKLTALGYTVTVVDDDVGGNANNYAVTFIYEDALSGTAFANVANLTTTERGVITSETFLHDEILGANQGATNNTNLVNITNNTHPITSGLSLGNNDIGDASFRANSLASGTVLGLHPNGEVAIAVWEPGAAMDVGTAPGRRAIVPHANSNGGFNAAGEDLLVNAIIWTSQRDTDQDGIVDCFDTDSDGDGCGDADEAYADANTDSDDNGTFGSGAPAVNGDGTVSAASYATPADQNTNGIPDYLEVITSPTITTQPVDMQTCPGCSTSFSVTASNANVFQWQRFNGSSWVDLTDSGIYSGSGTATLSIANPTSAENGEQYRVLVSNNALVCEVVTSNQVTLTLAVSTVITNRKITYRVNRN